MIDALQHYSHANQVTQQSHALPKSRSQQCAVSHESSAAGYCITHLGAKLGHTNQCLDQLLMPQINLSTGLVFDDLVSRVKCCSSHIAGRCFQQIHLSPLRCIHDHVYQLQEQQEQKPQ